MCSIEWTDIDAFIRITGTSLTAWDVSVIEELDDLLMSTKNPKPEIES